MTIRAWEKAYKEKYSLDEQEQPVGMEDPVALWYAIRGIPHQGVGGQHGIIVASGFHPIN